MLRTDTPTKTAQRVLCLNTYIHLHVLQHVHTDTHTHTHTHSDTHTRAHTPPRLGAPYRCARGLRGRRCARARGGCPVACSAPTGSASSGGVHTRWRWRCTQPQAQGAAAVIRSPRAASTQPFIAAEVGPGRRSPDEHAHTAAVIYARTSMHTQPQWYTHAHTAAVVYTAAGTGSTKTCGGSSADPLTSVHV